MEKQQSRQKEKEDAILEKAKTETRDLVSREIITNAKERANQVIRELNNVEKANLAKANNLRNSLNDELKEISPSASSSGLNLEALKELNSKFSLKNSNIKKSAHSSVTFAKGNAFKAQTISSEINVIGMNVDEATFVIDKYLDDCAIAKLSPVRIVHGKGTGKLREGIHKFLKTNPHVKSFRLGTFGEGEMGVTVVELN